MSVVEILHLVLGSSGLLGIVFLIFKTGKIVQKIENVEIEIRGLKTDLKELRSDVNDIRERVSFMEAFMFFSEFAAESNNSRSESAKKMWERRKAKKVEVKEN